MSTPGGTANSSPDVPQPPQPASAPQQPFAVLYVDDEEQALKYFKKAYANSFPVLTASGVDEALALLETEHARVGILLSDHRMPGKTGVELLAAVKDRWPHIMRILVTAYADMESAIAAVNSGAVFKYLTKPIDFAQTKVVLAHAMKSFSDARDREAAHTEREGMIERMIVADRVRSLARMATGVSHHVRNSLTAMSCFFEEMSDKVAAARQKKAAGAEGDAYLDELLELANEERQRLVGMVNAVEASGVRPSFQFAAQVDPAALASAAVAETMAAIARGVTVRVDVKPGLVALKADAAAVTRMLGTLIIRATRYSPSSATVRITADGPLTYWNTTAVRLRVLAEGPEWPEADVAAFFTPFSLMPKEPGDVGLELLDAFQAALGHEGHVVAHRALPAGPGFEVWLPLDPASVRRPTLVNGKLQLYPPAAA